ncbi:GNAT family N-acetyltransferase [Butyrivibrio sp. WCD2001]|uniref:GNAT family N-acetyltransferase n=1 Tax=Butyrivibrio sp. WCD2001 TaxID=1280681 RepID=UPI00040AB37C|nr:GNAT family N-acetyltransferase [Butyrivibrio sp. WCD2001]
MKNKYQYILFDLDGTLTDSGPGIMNGFVYAIQQMGGQVVDRSQLRKFVGPPLKVSFGDILGYSEEDTDRAIALYRDYYNNMGGVLENSVYPGIVELLSDLKSEGKKLIVATSKSAIGTDTVLKHFDLKKFFDFVATADDKERPHKSDVIRYALEQCEITDSTHVVMVGDRENDILAANEVGIDSIGVLYGYGDREELTSAGATYLAEHPSDVKKLVNKIELIDNILTPEDFVRLRVAAGFAEIPVPHAGKALQNGIINVSALKDGELIGMGRLVGDGAMYWYLQEIVVLPEYQGMGIGTMIVNHLVDYAVKNSSTGKFTTIGGVSAKGKEGFYKNLGFDVIPNGIQKMIEI